MTIKIDLSKVKTKDYVAWVTSLSANSGFSLALMVNMLDPAIEGGLSERPLTDLPAVLSQVMKVLTKFNDDINIAMGSMREYLKDKKE